MIASGKFLSFQMPPHLNFISKISNFKEIFWKLITTTSHWLTRCNHKSMNKWNLLGTISNICYKWTNAKSSNSISIFKRWFSTWKSGLQGWGYDFSTCSLLLGSSNAFFSLKEKVLFWKFDPLGSRARLCTCSLLLRSSDISFSLKEKALTWSVDLRGQGHVYVHILFT